MLGAGQPWRFPLIPLPIVRVTSELGRSRNRKKKERGKFRFHALTTCVTVGGGKKSNQRPTQSFPPTSCFLKKSAKNRKTPVFAKIYIYCWWQNHIQTFDFFFQKIKKSPVSWNCRNKWRYKVTHVWHLERRRRRRRNVFSLRLFLISSSLIIGKRKEKWQGTNKLKNLAVSCFAIPFFQKNFKLLLVPFFWAMYGCSSRALIVFYHLPYFPTSLSSSSGSRHFYFRSSVRRRQHHISKKGEMSKKYEPMWHWHPRRRLILWRAFVTQFSPEKCFFFHPVFFSVREMVICGGRPGYQLLSWS